METRLSPKDYHKTGEMQPSGNITDDTIIIDSDQEAEFWLSDLDAVAPPEPSPAPKRTKVSEGGYKSWVYTLNNYSEANVEAYKAIECTYHVMGFEKGDTGTEHLQGCLTFSRSTGFKRVQELLRGAHIEKAKNLEKARNYCMKASHGWYSEDHISKYVGGWGWPDFTAASKLTDS